MIDKRLIIFHPTIAPYRIDFFNDLYNAFDTCIYLYYENLKNQTLNYEEIKKKFEFEPTYLKTCISIGKRDFYLGHIKQILRKPIPDIVITGEYNIGTWAAVFASLLTRKKIKVVVVCDDSLDIAEKCSGIRKLSRNFIVRHLSGIILCDANVTTWYQNRFKSQVYYFPIIQNEEIFRKGLKDSIHLTKRYISEYKLEGKKVILFVGRLAKEKNIAYLIKSFFYALRTEKELVLVIIGDENINNNESVMESLKKECKKYDVEDKVLFLGHLEGNQLKAWYNIGQIFVLPSKYEPFGAVTNEALLAGQYVMISKYAGSRSLVDNSNGEIIDIDEEYINFDFALDKITPLEKEPFVRESKMPVAYNNKMIKLIKWLDAL